MWRILKTIGNKMNNWYIARSNEILVDMDKPSTSLLHAEKRLFGAYNSGALDVLRVEIHDSFTPNHIHVLITLKSPMPAFERVAWSLMFHSDIYRACTTIMRVSRGILAPDLLITPHKFERDPDCLCECPEKHDYKVMSNCPAAITIRGDERTITFFALPMDSQNILCSYERGSGDNKIWTPDDF